MAQHGPCQLLLAVQAKGRSGFAPGVPGAGFLGSFTHQKHCLHGNPRSEEATGMHSGTDNAMRFSKICCTSGRPSRPTLHRAALTGYVLSFFCVCTTFTAFLFHHLKKTTEKWLFFGFLDTLCSKLEWIRPLQEPLAKITALRSISVLEWKSGGRERKMPEKHGHIPRD